jgi:hypothetical protein
MRTSRNLNNPYSLNTDYGRYIVIHDAMEKWREGLNMNQQKVQEPNLAALSDETRIMER